MDLDSLEREARRRRDEAKAAADAKYEDTVRAIRKVRDLLSKNGDENNDSVGVKPDACVSIQKHVRPLRPAIEEVIRESLSNQDFTYRDVQNALNAKYPNIVPDSRLPSISSTLKRLEEEKMLVVLVRGSGKRASRYALRESLTAEELKAFEGGLQ